MPYPCVPTTPPLEGGSKSQVVFRYRGGATASIGRRGLVTKTEYRFANSPGHECFWVYAEDVDHFRGWPDDFEVLEETRIDPVSDLLRQLVGGNTSLKAKLREIEERTIGSIDIVPPSADAKPRARLKTGRPRTPEGDQALAWHLHHHGDKWTVPKAAAFLSQRTGRTVTEAAVSGWLKRGKKTAPPEHECPLCAEGYLPAQPE